MNSDREEVTHQPGPVWHLIKMRPRDAASLNKDSSQPYLARSPVWTTPENLRKMEKLEGLLQRRVVSKGGNKQQCDMCKQHKGSVRLRSTITVALSSLHWQLCDGCAATLNDKPKESNPNKVAASVEPRTALNKVAPSAEPRATLTNRDNVAVLEHRPRKLWATTISVAVAPAAVALCIAGFNGGSHPKKAAPSLEAPPQVVELDIGKAIPVEPETRKAISVEPEIRKAMPVQEQERNQQDEWHWEEIQLHKWNHYTTDGKTFMIGVFKERHLGDRKREVDAIAKQIRARCYRTWEHHKLGNVEEVKVVFYK